VGENERSVELALGKGSQCGIELSYARQPEPKGLAHALRCAKDHVGDGDFVLVLGDTVYSDGWIEFASSFDESGAACLALVAQVEDPRSYGVATIEGERIVRLVEKPAAPESNWAMAGVYFFGRAIWEAIENLKPSARGEFEITDAIQGLAERGREVLAGKYLGGWYDTGTLESFLIASGRFSGGRLVDPFARVSARLGENVVVGPGANVECGLLNNTVVLPGARVQVGGDISGCLIGGSVRVEGPLRDEIRYGDPD
jgi:glucose-1-phosphate thymidylyltransferase